MAFERGLTLTGARARLLLNGVKVGFGVNVSVQETLDHQPIDVLDDIVSQEHAPIGYSVSGSIQFVRLVGKSIKDAGWFAKQGATNEDFLRNILNNGELILAIEDNQTGQVVASVTGVRFSSKGMNISARGVVMEDVSWVGIKVRDESDISP